MRKPAKKSSWRRLVLACLLAEKPLLLQNQGMNYAMGDGLGWQMASALKAIEEAGILLEEE